MQRVPIYGRAQSLLICFPSLSAPVLALVSLLGRAG